MFEKKRQWELEMEKSPDRWYRYTMRALVERSRAAIAEYLNAEMDNLVMVQNAADGLNSILRSMKFARGDKLLLAGTTKGSTRNLARYLSNRFGVEIVDVNITKDDLQSDERILDKFNQTLVEHSPVKIAILKHVTSTPSRVLPIERLIPLFRGHKARLAIDGSHAVGVLNVSLSELQPDYYTADLHRWLLAPRNVGFLYMPEHLQQHLRPAIISANYKKGFVKEFCWIGTRNYAAEVTLEDTLDYRSAKGEEEIRRYVREMALEGARMIARTLETELLVNDSSSLAGMADVRLPRIEAESIPQLHRKLLAKKVILSHLHEFDGNVYLRVSAHIYNDGKDFATVGRVLNSLLPRPSSKCKEESLSCEMQC
eukprot:TRINITY_DN5679_c0_g2_i2.p1 TRINITY_DN5679_c0_g2~~TRINITY_DN5679_c0_g2_i2.p1  ORF type:complete len:370 (-),score=63.11 TRINITY_DN5679_c0_g2_i2:781-1890(-)